jgi:hypothetical protein
MLMVWCCREIASSIKTLLDAVNKVIAEMPQHMVENGTKQVRRRCVHIMRKNSNNKVL